MDIFDCNEKEFNKRLDNMFDNVDENELIEELIECGLDIEQPEPCYIKKCIKCEQEYYGKDNAWYGLCPNCNKEIKESLKNNGEELSIIRCSICNQDFVNEIDINIDVCPECIKKYNLKEKEENP